MYPSYSVRNYQHEFTLFTTTMVILIYFFNYVTVLPPLGLDGRR